MKGNLMSSMHDLFDGSAIDQDAPLPEPLFLLHTGALFDGERDDWDTEANIGAAVDALANARPGATIGLHDEHEVRRLLAAERASRQDAQIENEALKAECLRLQTKHDQAAGLVRRMKPVLAAAVALVCAPAWAGISDEDVALEQALRDAGMVLPSNGWPDTDAERSSGD
jgi:hypothetical protein